MAEEQKKKKKHTGRNVTIGVIAALLLSLGGWYGLGPGGAGIIGGGEANTGSQTGGVAETEKQEPAGTVEEPDMSDDGIMQIVISESEIAINGTSIASGELEDFLTKNYADGVRVTVKDEGAIKATYDEVVSALNKLDISYEIG